MKTAVPQVKQATPSATRTDNRAPFFTPFIQPKLTINQPNDIYEQEADTVADKVMRMSDTSVQREPFFKPAGMPLIQTKCNHCKEEEDIQRKEQIKETFGRDVQPISSKVQTKCRHCEEEEQRKISRQENGNSTPVATDSVEQTLQSPGHGMDGQTLDFMESRFGYDFSHVQIHNDNQAHQSSADINALAYTHQNHVVFGEGQYQPGTDTGKQLLAHELTHVVQQNGGINKKVVQKKNYFFAPVNKPSGTLVHNSVLPLFVKANSDLFIEVKIPGANKKDVDKGVTGIADFYKATPTGSTSRTIGINFDGNSPTSLGSSSKLEFGGGRYSHSKSAAPQGGVATPKVTKLSDAPVDISIGDLKPGFSSETFLGEGQVTDYKSGIKNTATDINSYVTANPAEADSKINWKPDPKSMSSLHIPPGVQYPGGAAFPIVPLSLYEESFTGVKKVTETDMKGRLFVYKDKVSGIWSYEWIPGSIPASTGSGAVNTVIDRLNDTVIPAITAVGSGGVAPKRLNKQSLPVQKQPKRIIQKSDKKFENEEWKKKYFTPWQTDAKAFLGNDKEVEKVRVAKTLVEVEERSGTGIGIPSEVKDRGKGLDKIKHWNRFGGIYGWFREKFDFIYIKLKSFGKKVKDKIAKLLKSSAGVKFSNWIKATAQVLFKIFKMVGSWVVGEVVDKLINSFREGVINNLKKLVDMYTPEDVKSKVEELEAMKDKYEQILNEEEDALIKKFFGDKLDLFEKLGEFEVIAGSLSTIVSLVEWGVRLLACASPPAIGCLWNLFISALEFAFSLLMQTCWFTKKVYKPVIDFATPVKNFPAEVAGKVVGVANEYIPMPEGFDPIFAPINIDTGEFKVDCEESGDGAGKLTPERQAIMDLLNAIGKEKLDALIQLMLKRGAGPWVLLTPERAAVIKDKLQNVSAETLLDLANNPSKGLPVELEAFMADIVKYNDQEKSTRKKYFDDKAKADAEKSAKDAAKQAGKPDVKQGGDTLTGNGSKGKDNGGGTALGSQQGDKVQVLDGKNYTIKDKSKGQQIPSFVRYYISATDLPGIKDGKNPGTVTINIYVDGTLTYHVQNVVVSSVEILNIVGEDMIKILIYFEYGIQLTIKNIDVIIQQLYGRRD